jgi:hypothetical protein
MRIKDKWKQSRELKKKKREKDLTMTEWIDRMLRESHPSILRVSGYREQLLKPFESAVSYLDGLISNIPGPFTLSADHWDKDPMTHALFVNSDEVRSVLNKCSDLKTFFKKSGLKTAVALLTATKKERTVFGTGMEGEIIHRDVPKVAVEFYDHRIVAPGAAEEESRKELVHRGLYVLTSNALEEFTEIKSIVEELKMQRRILDYKIKIQKTRERGLEGFMVGTNRFDTETVQAQKVIEDIDKQLKEFEQGAGTPKDFLRKLEKVLINAGNFLTEKSINLRLDWMGVKQKETSAENSLEINLAELEIPQRAKRVAVLACISADECLGL